MPENGLRKATKPGRVAVIVRKSISGGPRSGILGRSGWKRAAQFWRFSYVILLSRDFKLSETKEASFGWTTIGKLSNKLCSQDIFCFN